MIGKGITLMGYAATQQEESRVVERQSGFMKWVFGLSSTAIVTGILLLAPLVNTRHSAALAATRPAPQLAKEVAQMPEGKGKDIIVVKCQVCHTVARIVISRRPKDEWEYLVGQMIARGAPITLEELPIVLDYLAANFGPADSPASTAAAVATATLEATRMADPDQAQFSAVAASMGLPGGAQMSIVSGDPSKAGLFSILVKIPAGTVIQPHWYLGDENIVSLRGTFQMGKGDTFDAGKLQTLNPGAVWHISAKMHYFAEAKDSATILIYGQGPLFGLSEPESLSSFLHIQQLEEVTPNGRLDHGKAAEMSPTFGLY
jgi:hypothetical protein